MVTVEDIGKRVEDAWRRGGILRGLIPDYKGPAELPQQRRERATAFLWPDHGAAGSGCCRPAP